MTSKNEKQKELFDQFLLYLEILDKGHVREEVNSNSFLTYSLKNNQYYDHNFWEQTDDLGNHAMLALLKKSGHAINLYPLLEEAAPHLVTKPNHQGECLLHVAWNVRTRSYNKDASLDTILSIQEKTDPAFWTWLDKPNEKRGAGWIKNILRNDPTSHPSLVKIVENIGKEFPSPPLPENWLTVHSQHQAQLLQVLGGKITDELKIANVSFPVWKVLLAISDYRSHSLTSGIEKNNFPEVSPDEVVSFKKEVLKMEHLRPKDQRAKIGYVRSILECQEKNVFNISSLQYLFIHRQDLLSTLVSEMRSVMSKKGPEEYKSFVEKDALGCSFLFHAFCHLKTSDFSEVKKMCRDFDLDISLNIDRRGWFVKEKELSRWVQMTSLGQTHQYRQRTPPITSLEMLSVEELFGDLKNQENFVSRMEKELLVMPEKIKQGFVKDSSIDLVRQLWIFVILEYDNKLPKEVFSETLKQQYKTILALFCHTRKLEDIFDLISPKPRQNVSVLVKKIIEDIPEIFTPSMEKLIQSDIFAPNTPQKNIWDNHPTVSPAWRTNLEKFNIKKALSTDLKIDDFATSKTKPNKKM